MTTPIERPTTSSQRDPDTHVAVNPVEVIIANPGQHSMLEVAQAYFALGERPIPLCDANHAFVSAWHRDGYRHKDGTLVASCLSPGMAPMERDYSRFATTPPSAMDIVRMFGSHRGNIGGVVPSGLMARLLGVTFRAGAPGPFINPGTLRGSHRKSH